MRTKRYGLVFPVGLILAAGGLGVSGCGGSNPNEREFLQTAPPGKPSEIPNESVADRKARTKGESHKVQKGRGAGQGATPR
jgi:hypothetical protein